MPVGGRVQERDGKLLLVLDERLTGRDTFLSAVVLVATPAPAAVETRVRILTFDDVTVLLPFGSPLGGVEAGQRWTGTLLLPHGSRPPDVPDDFAQSAGAAGIDTGTWSPAETRQLLTYLGEASGQVRAERIRTIINALTRPA
ncbi:hypothetical protein ACFVQ4_15040 [Streptomyces laurentii]|uniref:hypothetical protein n=1 Tax=Streptomyces laurentii TaxID=39478 RepID=UPI0036825BE4